jgi:DNA-binding phage protein
MATARTNRPATQDTSFHDRRLARRLREDPEFREEFERQQREIAAIDHIVHSLDALRAKHGLTKAELARAIDKNPAAVRRLLTASGNPELRTVVAMAEALDAEVQIVPRKGTKRRKSKTLQHS